MASAKEWYHVPVKRYPLVCVHFCVGTKKANPKLKQIMSLLDLTLDETAYVELLRKLIGVAVRSYYTYSSMASDSFLVAFADG